VDYAPSPPPGTKPTPVPTPDPWGYTWTHCADETQHCTCASGSMVRYGWTGSEKMYENDGEWFKKHPEVVKWLYRDLESTEEDVVCTPESFPGDVDPFPGFDKHCQCADSGLITSKAVPIPVRKPPAPAKPAMPAGKFAPVNPNIYLWEHCAAEGDECMCANRGAYVRYGSTGEEGMYSGDFFETHPEIRKWDYLALPDYETNVTCTMAEFEGSDPFPGHSNGCMCADRGPGDELAVAAMGMKEGKGAKNAKAAPLWAERMMMKRTTKLASKINAGSKIKGYSPEDAAMAESANGVKVIHGVPILNEVRAQVGKREAAAAAERAAHSSWVNGAIDKQMATADEQVAAALAASMATNDQSLPTVESYDGGSMAAVNAVIGGGGATNDPAKKATPAVATMGKGYGVKAATKPAVTPQQAAAAAAAAKAAVVEKKENAGLPPAAEPLYEDGLTGFEIEDMEWTYCAAEGESCACSGSALRYGSTGDKSMYEKAARWFRLHRAVKKWAYIRISTSRVLDAALGCGGTLIGGLDPFPDHKKICQCGRTPAEALAHSTAQAALGEEQARAALGAVPVAVGVGIGGWGGIPTGGSGVMAAAVGAAAVAVGVGLMAARRVVSRRKEAEHAERVVLCAKGRNEFGVFYGDAGV
jgi:hypothetical protein